MTTMLADHFDVTIRSAESRDVLALADLAARTWSDAFGGSISPEELAVELESKRSEAYFVDALKTRSILVAEEGASLLGYVQFGDVDIAGVSSLPGDQELQRLYVETHLQGHGLGQRLLNEALSHPRLAGAKRVYLQIWEQNERAVRLYESCGFRKAGKTTFALGNDVVEDLVMVLDKTRDAAAPA